jgi:hypothetical protein
MVQTMAQWLGIDWLDSSIDGRLQREIVLQYAQLIQWRGTKRGLQTLLELLSGAPATVRDSGGVFAEGESPAAEPHVRLDVESAGWNSVADLVRIVRDELPATVTFDLWVAGERVWPSAEALAMRTGALPRPRTERASRTAAVPVSSVYDADSERGEPESTDG